MADLGKREVLDPHRAASDANDFEAEHSIHLKTRSWNSHSRASGVVADGTYRPRAAYSRPRSAWSAPSPWPQGPVDYEFILTYDGKPSYAVNIMEFRDMKVARETQYFAAGFMPASRLAPWAELQSSAHEQ